MYIFVFYKFCMGHASTKKLFVVYLNSNLTGYLVFYLSVSLQGTFGNS